MSATKSAIACRSPLDAYGARYALLASLPMRPCAVASVVRRKAEVRRQPRSRSSSWRAKRIGSGTPPGGIATPVLASRIPSTCSWCSSAQPSAIGPPQSWAATTTGPSTPNASRIRPRSSTRCAYTRGPVRSESPIETWSTAITR